MFYAGKWMFLEKKKTKCIFLNLKIFYFYFSKKKKNNEVEEVDYNATSNLKII